MPARHEEIAEELRRAIDREEYTVGSLLPAETELAAQYAVSRGTVRRAVASLTAEGLIGSRQGARRVVLAGRRSQSFAELRSFAQWARAMGREATGHVVTQEYRPATAEDAVRLQLREKATVLHVVRVRGLDGEPVLWSAPCTPTGSPRRRGHRARLPLRHPTPLRGHRPGLRLRRARHRRGGGRRPGRRPPRRPPHQPLLRVRRVTTTREGRPVEWSDDRYRSDAVSFSVHNSIGNNALARKTAE